MPKQIAFLRAVNVGGRTVAMERLRQVFESLGLTGVETYIASGNVVFESPARNRPALEKKIEASLRDTFGFVVTTFVRTADELAAVAAYEPFTAAELKDAAALNVAFLKEAPEAASVQRLMALRSDIDDFHVGVREVYWICRRKQSKSKFSNAALEKALGQPSTLRGINTVRKMAEKYL